TTNQYGLGTPAPSERRESVVPFSVQCGWSLAPTDHTGIVAPSTWNPSHVLTERRASTPPSTALQQYIVPVQPSILLREEDLQNLEILFVLAYAQLRRDENKDV